MIEHPNQNGGLALNENLEKDKFQRSFTLMSDDTWYTARAFHEENSNGEVDDFHEELNINWCLFGLRFTTVVLMACLIASLCLGEIVDERIFYIAAIIFIISAICLIGSFFDCFKRRIYTTTYAGDMNRSLVDNDSLSADSLSAKKSSGKSLIVIDK